MVVAYCSFCPKMPQKASKRGLLAQKSGGLLEFQSSGGLIKSGLLFARMRYMEKMNLLKTYLGTLWGSVNYRFCILKLKP